MSQIFVWEIQYDVVDLTGFEVEATDGRIGKVDEATNEGGGGFLVVDTGFWIFGKRRMVPAGLVTAIDVEERTVQLGVTKEQVKDAPDFDDAQRSDAARRDEVGSHYAGLRGDTIGPVAGTGRAAGELGGDPIAPVPGVEHSPDA